MHCFYSGSARLQQLLVDKWKHGQEQLKALLGNARKVTICLDGWSKTSLTASFLGISACFFDSKALKVRHVVLDLCHLEHPHTGELLAEHLEQCMQKWSLTSNSILMLVSDNGSNMIKAVRLLNERHQDLQESDESLAKGEVSSSEDESSADSNNESSDAMVGSAEEIDDESYAGEVSDIEQIELDVTDLQNYVPYQRLMCVAHTLQLVIRKAYTHYDNILMKVRRLIGKIKKSSVAVGKLKKKTGKVLITDNSTRWNSTYLMVSRLIDLKDDVNYLLADMKKDSLLVSEWARLGELCQLLKPFAEQTDKLQGNSMSLSNVIPALLELEYHLQSCCAPKVVTKAMLDDMTGRFRCIRDPSSPDFMALPAASCLLDPSVASLMITEDMASLLEAAKDFIVCEVLATI